MIQAEMQLKAFWRDGRFTQTSSHHPQANGLIERFHRALKTTIRCRREDWLIIISSFTWNSFDGEWMWIFLLLQLLLAIKNCPNIKTNPFGCMKSKFSFINELTKQTSKMDLPQTLDNWYGNLRVCCQSNSTLLRAGIVYELTEKWDRITGI